MARSQGLQVRVVTGQGYDGQGGSGPHAWNEVYITDRQAWIPLDSTWAVSGDWFNPKDFDKTHVKESML
ncbi:Transglutaminase-like superfamily protein [compost metagenome]